jgi:hypothetical protein
MVPWRCSHEKPESVLFRGNRLQSIEKSRLPEGWRNTREALFKL